MAEVEEVAHNNGAGPDRRPTVGADDDDDVHPLAEGEEVGELRGDVHKEPVAQNWAVVKKRVRALSVAKKIVTNNVTSTNKMGVYAWDEVSADRREFTMAVSLQLGIGMIKAHPASPRGTKTVVARVDGGEGFEGVTIPSFTFTEHFPERFALIRQQFDMEPRVYDASLGIHSIKHKPNLRVINSKQASGKSGAWFFFSSDMRFAIKTCTAADFKELTRILDAYCEHTQSPTLLPKYCGLYTVAYGTHHRTFLVMNNVFAGYLDIHQRFDIKGSTAGRKASTREKEKKHCVLKDLDLKESVRELPLGSRVRAIIQRDAEFLARVRVIDYSLLLGFHFKKEADKWKVPAEQQQMYGSPESKAHHGVLYVENDDVVIYLGVVDILTAYGAFKHLETFFRGTLPCKDVSCQPPKKYARRYERFLLDMIPEGDVELHGL